VKPNIHFRWLFNGLAALSLVICVATAVLWVRSYWFDDEVHMYGPNDGYGCSSWGGNLMFIWGPTYHGFKAIPYPAKMEWEYLTAKTTSLGASSITVAKYRRLASFGFAYDPNQPVQGNGRIYYSGYRLFLPHWLFCLLFLAAPAAWYWQRIRDRRLAAEGRCLTCGYDLRATPDRCPECGGVPEKVKL
jgi:hypothetical protein